MSEAVSFFAEARQAIDVLRDAAREGKPIDFHCRERLVLLLHRAVDAAEQATKYNTDDVLRQAFLQGWLANFRVCNPSLDYEPVPANPEEAFKAYMSRRK